MTTTDTLAQELELNVYDDGDSQVWVSVNNIDRIREFSRSSFLFIGKVIAIVVEPHIECIEVKDSHILPPIDTVGCLCDGVTIVRIVSHVEDIKPFC